MKTMFKFILCFILLSLEGKSRTVHGVKKIKVQGACLGVFIDSSVCLEENSVKLNFEKDLEIVENNGELLVKVQREEVVTIHCGIKVEHVEIDSSDDLFLDAESIRNLNVISDVAKVRLDFIPNCKIFSPKRLSGEVSFIHNLDVYSKKINLKYSSHSKKEVNLIPHEESKVKMKNFPHISKTLKNDSNKKSIKINGEGEIRFVSVQHEFIIFGCMFLTTVVVGGLIGFAIGYFK